MKSSVFLSSALCVVPDSPSYNYSKSPSEFGLICYHWGVTDLDRNSIVSVPKGGGGWFTVQDWPVHCSEAVVSAVCCAGWHTHEGEEGRSGRFSQAQCCCTWVIANALGTLRRGVNKKNICTIFSFCF